jgi:hypothetical protein
VPRSAAVTLGEVGGAACAAEYSHLVGDLVESIVSVHLPPMRRSLLELKRPATRSANVVSARNTVLFPLSFGPISACSGVKRNVASLMHP